MIHGFSDISLADYCTFRTGGNAKIFYEPASEQEIIQTIADLKKDKIPYFILGNGSNVLVSDKGYDGAIIHIGEKFSAVTVLPDNKIFAESGATLFQIARIALDNSLKGLEFASGIPGTLGGGITMNAGAYDGELKNVLESVKILTDGLRIVTTDIDDMDMSYRHSRIQDENSIVLGGTFRLSAGEQTEIENRMKDFSRKRSSKQPLNYPSAGSTFRRPQNCFAGTTIEQCGLKGKTIGGAQVSEKHAGFIINKNNATSSDIYNLIRLVQQTVKEQTGIQLETEVKLLGDFE